MEKAVFRVDPRDDVATALRDIEADTPRLKFGFPVPTGKIASNSTLTATKRNWIGLVAGRAP
ncbi:hypothetical protein [Sphingomonas sp. PR090111-T3T-6A]|uniref:hypothetical protein n=1 Tax=Sphingomonas sp. PR090111-T3T-6A TaxID=685778 RepID=UPI00036E0730|nr:hypothetical protein [Sphingomonas sp. PR090111-T3T-6A]